MRPLMWKRISPAIAFLLVGCAVGPNYKRPPLNADGRPIPAAFKEAPAAADYGSWKPAAPQDAKPRGPWWEMFGDPRLNMLESQVTVNNQNIHLAEAQYRQARAVVREAESNLFPTVNGQGTVVRQKAGSGAVASNAARGGNAGVSTNYEASANASWELDVWGRLRRTVSSNKALAQASAADLESARLSAHAELAQDYFLICQSDAQIALLAETITAYRRSLEITRNRYAAGVAAKSDVTQAETQLALAEAGASEASLTRAQLEHAIAVLVGKAPADFSLPATTCAATLPIVPAVLPSQLLERRPDIAGAERRVKAANAAVGAAIGAYFPQLGLTGSGGALGNSFSELFSAPVFLWSFGAQLTQTLFDGGMKIAQTKEARAAYDASVAQYRQTVLAAFQDTEDNLAAIRLLDREAAEQARATAAANQSLTLVLNQYQAGTVSYLNVVTAQAAAYASRSNDLAIGSRRAVATAGLIKSLGGSWSPVSENGQAASPAR